MEEEKSKMQIFEKIETILNKTTILVQKYKEEIAKRTEDSQ